jgi:hypothetical protein
MSKRKVRTLRHWKQRYDKNAKFIWRKPLTWAGKKVTVGDPIPEDFQPAKLRRFWESGVIELAEFKEPKNILTGGDMANKPDAPKVPANEFDEETDPPHDLEAKTTPEPEPKPRPAKKAKAKKAKKGSEDNDFLV